MEDTNRMPNYAEDDNDSSDSIQEVKSTSKYDKDVYSSETVFVINSSSDDESYSNVPKGKKTRNDDDKEIARYPRRARKQV